MVQIQVRWSGSCGVMDQGEEVNEEQQSVVEDKEKPAQGQEGQEGDGGDEWDTDLESDSRLK